MRRKPSRNALKGYTYQTYILALLLAKMDVDRTIKTLSFECLVNHQFDDISITTTDDKTYWCQVKNNRGATINDITVFNDRVIIKGKEAKLDNEKNNVIIINTENIKTNNSFFGIPSVIKEGVVIVPVSEKQVSDNLGEMYKTIDRAMQIMQLALEKTIQGKTEISQSDLPEIMRLSMQLNEKTILLRKVPEINEYGVTHIVGKPGVGKSHFVNELVNKFPDAIVYRFWINSQDAAWKTRLQYEHFIEDVGLNTFKSPKNFSENELIEELFNNGKILIIDGLDHVENYLKIDLDKYISFLEKIDKKGIRAVLLSRPLRRDTKWQKMELLNWNTEETRLYLCANYNLSDYSIQNEIFRISNGYPIITYYLAEHYKKFGEIGKRDEISDLNQYYAELLKDVQTKAALCTFATCTSFITIDELKLFNQDPESIEIIQGFIREHPYLFEQILNRVSLIHDSLNTFLRKEIASFPDKEKRILSIIENSILSGEVEFLSRLNSFNFEESFYERVLHEYCSFDALKKLLNNTIDYDSISNLYKQLKTVLEKRKGVFSASEYYAFSLLCQVIQRNNLIGDEGLIYQVLEYAKRFGNIENQVFSSNSIWHVYLATINDTDRLKQYLNNSYYSNNQLDEVLKTLTEEKHFFDRLTRKIDYEKVEQYLKEESVSSFEKMKVLEEYLVSIYIDKNDKNYYYQPFLDYIEKKDNKSIIDVLVGDGFDLHFSRISVNKAVSIIGGLGLNDAYRNPRKSLMECILESAPGGSFQVVPFVQSIIRLASYEHRDIDICSVNYVWTMYYERKDYSVVNIDDALLVFEKRELIDELDSCFIINKLLDQSEKGIRHLLNSYINKKELAFINTLVENKCFNKEFNADVFQFKPEAISLLPKDVVLSRLREIIMFHSYSNTIEYQEIENVMESSYGELVLEIIGAHGFEVRNFDGSKESRQALINYNIDFSDIIEDKSKESEYVPFAYGSIDLKDIKYIKEKNIDALEIAKYKDGWSDCLPFPNMYKLYDSGYIKEIALEIIHISLLTRTELNYYGNWFCLIGNIPVFYDILDINVDWQELFDIFIGFLDISLIAHH